VRSLVEVFAAERAAQIASAAERDELQEIGARMRAAVATSSFEEYSGLNRLLHRRIREIARHDVAAEVIENLRNRAAVFDIRLAVVPGRAGRSVVEHQAIIDAICAGDAAGAGRAVKEHLGSVVEALRAWPSISS
jgi:DNA-binding GntR family transcriptional regulator